MKLREDIIWKKVRGAEDKSILKRGIFVGISQPPPSYK
jgi:hypothetical protein